MYYKNLEAWKEAIILVKQIYIKTKQFPQEELYGLTSQIKRAVISIPSNIAEGMSRYSDNDKSRFIDIAIGSLAEVETQLIISKELGFVEDIDEELQSINKIKALVIGLKKYLNKEKGELIT
ncbi:four helix bundle protein [bacterium]|nr:four helix bundle protein [bacterium]